MAMTLDQRRAHATFLRGEGGRFESRKSRVAKMMTVSHVVPEYAALQLRRMGYGQRVIEECAESLALRLNVDRDFSDEAFKEIAAEAFRDRFMTEPEDYLTVRSALGDNEAALSAIDRMLERDTPEQLPGFLKEKSRELLRRPVFDVSDPRVQNLDPSVEAVSHQGIVYHKCNENTQFPDGRVEGVRIQSAEPISDEQMHHMAALVAYDHSGVLHSQGSVSVPFRDSPNSFIVRSIPKVKEDEKGNSFVKGELAPRSAFKIGKFVETLPHSALVGSQPRKDGSRAVPGMGAKAPKGMSVFLALTPMERKPK